MAVFKLLGSRQTHMSPFGFLRNVTEETQGVGSTYSVMISSSIRKSSSLSIASFDSMGTFLLVCCAGFTVGSILMLYSPFKLPSLSKELGYSFFSCSTVLHGTVPG